MQEMIEPDRTILIVSVIGLIVIWGSVAYHKWVQDSAPARPDPEDEVAEDDAPKTDAVKDQVSASPRSPIAASAPGGGRKRKKNKGR